MDKILLVNGVGMTSLTPITKMMAHFTLAHLQQPPQNALIICFGMGTTFRSAMSWGIPVTVVELVPKVPKLFPYYHPDGRALLKSPNAHVVIDDGRRFLDRTNQKFDAIIIDPPPPIEAAASSLLYSRDFYAVAKQHLTPGGILQQWIYDGGDNTDRAAITRALTDVFPYVRAYQSLERWGRLSFPCQHESHPRLYGCATGCPYAGQCPHRHDGMGPGKDCLDQYGLLASHEVQTKDVIAPAANTPSLQDDRPINEYYWLRQKYPRLFETLQ